MSFEGDRLKALRSERDLTQQQLADWSGIEREKIAKIETDRRRMSATDAAYLAQALGVRAQDLIERPRHAVHWRTSEPLAADGERSASVKRVEEWFDAFVEDALYLERRASRYGLD
ncbi:MAG TPA: helix-turn-helix transcriptional regulator [Dermatophilaceae bacterium]